MVDTDEYVLTAQDRCDSCNAQAYFQAIFESGDLNFCYHHFMKNENALREFSYYIIDQSELLRK